MKNSRTFIPPDTNFLLSPVSHSVRANKNVIIAGAGVFGSWTALKFLRNGYNVKLFDPWGPGNSRASSGGETRLIRAAYGRAKLYTQLTLQSITDWEVLQENSEQIYFQTGVLWLAHEETHQDIMDSINSLEELNQTLKKLSSWEVSSQYPYMNKDDIVAFYLEEKAGFILARTAVRKVVNTFIREGGEFIPEPVKPGRICNGWMQEVRTTTHRHSADYYIFACGPWIPDVFPSLNKLLKITKQNIMYFGLPRQSVSFLNACPWVDWNPGNIHYGIPSHDYRGFKVANDIRGPEFDPTRDDRVISPDEISGIRNYLKHRFPELAKSPMIEGRVCQYTNTVDGNFVIDTHPEADNCWIVSGGSGHGFKLGPAVGQLVFEWVSENRERLPVFRIKQ